MISPEMRVALKEEIKNELRQELPAARESCCRNCLRIKSHMENSAPVVLGLVRLLHLDLQTNWASKVTRLRPADLTKMRILDWRLSLRFGKSHCLLAPLWWALRLPLTYACYSW